MEVFNLILVTFAVLVWTAASLDQGGDRLAKMYLLSKNGKKKGITSWGGARFKQNSQFQNVDTPTGRYVHSL